MNRKEKEVENKTSNHTSGGLGEFNRKMELLEQLVENYIQAIELLDSPGVRSTMILSSARDKYITVMQANKKVWELAKDISWNPRVTNNNPNNSRKED